MKQVLVGALLGAVVGLVPAIIYLARLTRWETWNEDHIYLVLACGAAVLGALLGSTRALLEGYRGRHRSATDRRARGRQGIWEFLKNWDW